MVSVVAVVVVDVFVDVAVFVVEVVAVGEDGNSCISSHLVVVVEEQVVPVSQ